MAVKDYNVDPDLNTTIEGINIAEGCPPSGINNAIRQLMADVKEESEAQAQAVEQARNAAALDATAKVSTLDSTLREFIEQEVEGVVRSVNGVSADAAGNVNTVTRYEDLYNYTLRYNDGTQICMGQAIIGAGEWHGYINFPAAFRNVNYSIVATAFDASYAYRIAVSNISTTGATVCAVHEGGLTNYKRAIQYIAIGTWK